MRREYYMIEEGDYKTLMHHVNEMAQSGWRMEHFNTLFLTDQYELPIVYTAVMVKEPDE